MGLKSNSPLMVYIKLTMLRIYKTMEDNGDKHASIPGSAIIKACLTVRRFDRRLNHPPRWSPSFGTIFSQKQSVLFDC